MAPQAFIPLSLLSLELRKLSGGQPPSSRQIYRLVLDGVIPARLERNRWYVERADLPSIAEQLGLSVAQPTTRRRRTAGVPTASVAA